eukprot:1055219-Rhodomonas_salina.2
MELDVTVDSGVKRAGGVGMSVCMQTLQAGTAAECAGGGRVVGASERQRRVEGSCSVMVQQRLVCVGWGVPAGSSSQHPLNTGWCTRGVHSRGCFSDDGSDHSREASAAATSSGH